MKYKSHRFFCGKPQLDGLPSTYAESCDDVMTLEIILSDVKSGIELVL